MTEHEEARSSSRLRLKPLSPSERRYALMALSAVFVLSILSLVLSRLPESALSERFQSFVTIFLGIFIEAVPFLLAGSIVSGLIAVYVDQASLAQFIPRRPALAALTGTLMGLAFPVCECGVVPVTRRLFQKGLPLPVGVAFLLAAPVINPVVILSTYAAFGWGPVLIGRFVLTIVIAFIVAMLFSLALPKEVLLYADELPGDEPAPGDTMTPLSSPGALGIVASPLPNMGRFWNALAYGADDFLDMVRYLVVGSMLAAGMQAIVPQQVLLALGGGPVVSVIVLMVLAFVLSVCSTVDAFLALSFVSAFTPGSIIAFLVFGPMVDIKSSLMFLGVFQKRIVLYLILLPAVLTLLFTIFLNLRVGW